MQLTTKAMLPRKDATRNCLRQKNPAATQNIGFAIQTYTIKVGGLPWMIATIPMAKSWKPKSNDCDPLFEFVEAGRMKDIKYTPIANAPKVMNGRFNVRIMFD